LPKGTPEIKLKGAIMDRTLKLTVLFIIGFLIGAAIAGLINYIEMMLK
jgi:hypothetical protein